MNKAFVLGLGLLLATPIVVNSADAAANYRQHCSKCHGEDGRGKTKAGQRLGARDYTDPKVQASVSDEAIAKSITQGYKDKKTGRQIMKPTQGLTDAEVKELVAYMRKFKKN
ncbi:MAG: cytochrome c [Verrucomicrobia bacterium]|nr:cytochrome c [Verrucomicrobiota bacterium]